MENIVKSEQPAGPPDIYSVTDFETSESQPAPNIIKPILKRWYIILLMFFLISGAGVPAVWYFIHPKFKATAAIEISPILSNILYSDRSSESPMPMYDTYKNTQIQILKSEKIMIDRVLPKIYDKDLLVFQTHDPMQQPLSKKDALKKALQDGIITIQAPRTNQLILVSMESEDRREAELIVNTIVTEYTNYVEVEINAKENKKIETLKKEEYNLITDLNLFQKDLSKLAEKYGTTSLTGLYDMMLQRVSSIQGLLTDVEARKFAVQARMNQFQKYQNLETLSGDELQSLDHQFVSGKLISERENEYIQNNSTVAALTSSITLLEQELIAAKLKYSDSNPELTRITQQLEAYQQKLDEHSEQLVQEFHDNHKQNLVVNIKNQIDKTKAELEQIESHENMLKTQLDVANQTTKELGMKQLEINKMVEQIGLSKEMLTDVRRRIRQMEVERKRPARINLSYLASSNLVPDKRIKFSLGILMGSLALGTFLAFLSGKFDQRLNTPDEIMRCIGLPMLGTTTSSDQVNRSKLAEHIAYDYQTIQANLGLLNQGTIPHCIAVTSPAMGDGKTTLAINLSSSLAKIGKKVLLIDGDLRQPDIAHTLNIPDSAWGLADLILGLKQPEEIIHTIPLTGLDIMPASHRNAAAAIEQLSLPHTFDCIKEIGRQYDHVIIDTPPVLAAPDALLWARFVDAVVLSGLAGHTAGPELKETLDRLRSIQANILGTVLSNVHVKHSYNRYGYYGSQSGADASSSNLSKEPLLLVESEANDLESQSG